MKTKTILVVACLPPASAGMDARQLESEVRAKLWKSYVSKINVDMV